MPTVGIMAAGTLGPLENFKAGMRDCGFIERETVRYELRVAHGDSDRLLGFAGELVRASVDLIAVVGAVTARAARTVTRDIPIVYAVVVDPVSDGLATVSRQPLGNMTGMTTYDPDQARMHIALLRSVKPDLARIALLADSGVSNCLTQVHSSAMQEAGVRPQVVRIAGPDPDLIDAFAAMQREGTDALVVLEHPVNGANAARIAELALAHCLPTGVARAQADAGGLFAYGTSLRGAAYQMAGYASRILRGTEPSDLPVETFHCTELVVNMRTARNLGLTVPPDILTRAVCLID
ncbi:ABC transporter substrate-binding protein [Bradyrhizobium sp. URHD0069]|uniref:ABC transporter substrate-binding protein n=1 Tax=Bradyrhizobium sp. URHD0069 TaxID=1380355 RepID=UPI00049748B8|nr:ABC transporter substrate-binding protein [Bradyrhizobium sp. URHD0069]